MSESGLGHNSSTLGIEFHYFSLHILITSYPLAIMYYGLLQPSNELEHLNK